MPEDLLEREFHPLKCLHHVDRLRALAAGRDIAPVTVEIDPVAYCNHDCGWCVDPVHANIRMPEKTYRALLTELRKFSIDGRKVEGIVLKGGGEPTLHPSFGELVESAVESGFSVGVVTNGSRLERWAGALGTRAAYVRISIDGPTPESHALIHRSRDFDQIIGGVRRLLESRASARHPIVGLSFAMDRSTAPLAEEAIRLSEELGVDYVLLRPPFFEEVGREPTMSVAEAREVRRHLRAIGLAHSGPVKIMVGNWIGDTEQRERMGKALDESSRRDLQVSSKVPIEHRTGRCLASPLLAVVAADGSVYGCCNLRALPRWSFGRLDYDRGVGFSEIWSGLDRRQVLSRMHRTECIGHCTHPLQKYNEMIEVLRDSERSHSEFV